MLLVSGATRTLARLGPRSDLGRLFVPRQRARWRTLTDRPWALDNGCFSGFDVDAWVDTLHGLRGAPHQLFVVVPDVVADHRATLRLWARWAPVVSVLGFRPAFVAQDGCREVPSDARALFIGGSTAFKESPQALELVRQAKRCDLWVHMGRVNTLRRLRLAIRWGIDSVDGSSFSRWSETHIPKALAWTARERAQGWLWGGRDE